MLVPKPLVAIVGRPNVGKSTLINRLAATRQAIVDLTAGVTRDRNYIETEWRGLEFTLIDTGGIVVDLKEELAQAVKAQALAAVAEADLILMLVDYQTGLTTEDEEIANILRTTKKPIFLVVNKVDRPEELTTAPAPFYALGLGTPITISASHGLNIGELLDLIVEQLPPTEISEETEAEIKVALVGRPNAGKSSLFNSLIGQPRAIVSQLPGTTRDAIDTCFTFQEKKYRFIDTAGLRKTAKALGHLEYYSFLRAQRALEAADIALLVVDGEVGVTNQDQHIASLAWDKNCALIVLLNKWDLLSKESRQELKLMVAAKLRFIDSQALVFLPVSARTGFNLNKVLPLINSVFASYAATIATAKLNSFLQRLKSKHLPSKGGKQLKLKYITQLKSRPPAFLFFVNNPKIVDGNFKRYLIKNLQQEFNLRGTPIKCYFRRES